MARKFQLHKHYKQVLADTFTPVSVYLKLRDKFPNTILLESRDFHAGENSFSYICFNPIASIKVDDGIVTKEYPDNTTEETLLTKDINKEILSFTEKFQYEPDNFKFISKGLFGYMGYDAVRYFEDIEISKENDSINIPDIYYNIYQNIIAIDHFKNEAYLFCYTYGNAKNNIDEIEQYIYVKNFSTYKFNLEGEVTSNMSDEDFIKLVDKSKKHCQRGDVFQMVLSRRFSQNYRGDDFNVYRALRSINPSPYLFFFDYGDFKIFGSSPEAQLVVHNDTVEIYPIAGTFKRTGDDNKDIEIAKQLADDPKENAEHVMLVDLARNDLSRNCSQVKVEKYKEIQFFSHVIHLVSKVIGKIRKGVDTPKIVADTFPAGTLSGAPKYKAMQLIEKYESENRSFYAGAIGFMDIEGNYNHAIMIRTFLSKNYTLYYQAGAGVVSKSNAHNEMQEVHNKIGALKNALKNAELL